jgi:hypothetical protein
MVTPPDAASEIRSLILKTYSFPIEPTGLLPVKSR